MHVCACVCACTCVFVSGRSVGQSVFCLSFSLTLCLSVCLSACMCRETGVQRGRHANMRSFIVGHACHQSLLVSSSLSDNMGVFENKGYLTLGSS